MPPCRCSAGFYASPPWAGQRFWSATLLPCSGGFTPPHLKMPPCRCSAGFYASALGVPLLPCSGGFTPPHLKMSARHSSPSLVIPSSARGPSSSSSRHSPLVFPACHPDRRDGAFCRPEAEGSWQDRSSHRSMESSLPLPLPLSPRLSSRAARGVPLPPHLATSHSPPVTGFPPLPLHLNSYTLSSLHTFTSSF